MTIDELSRRLHEINVLDMTGNTSKASKAVEALNQELAGSHLACLWNLGTREWHLVDTRLFEREDEE